MVEETLNKVNILCFS